MRVACLSLCSIAATSGACALFGYSFDGYSAGDGDAGAIDGVAPDAPVGADGGDVDGNAPDAPISSDAGADTQATIPCDGGFGAPSVPCPLAWGAGAKMLTGRYGLVAVTGTDGMIYALGGNSSDTNTLADVYAPATDRWTRLPAMPTPRADLAAAAGLDGAIYAIGGYDGVQELSSVDIFEPSANRWVAGTPMSMPRVEMAAVTGNDGRIYVLGGWYENNLTGMLATVEAYDPKTSRWTTLAPMPTKRARIAVAPGADGRIYAFGGWDGNGGSLATAEVYDPRTNQWTSLSALPTPRSGPGVGVGAEGSLYVFGGYASDAASTVEAYDPARNTWSAAGSMPDVRTAFGWTTGRDGRFYVMGGVGPGPGVLDTMVIATQLR